MFKPNVDHFDLVINFKTSYCVKAYQKVEITEGVFLPHYREYDTSGKEKSGFPVVDFDPTRNYVEELRQSYSELALFFYDIYGCTQIYVLWKPDALKSKELKINNAKYSIINSSKNKFELNFEAIIEDFKIIGSELVEDIIIKNNKIFQ